MAGEHQVDIVRFCPRELIRRVGQEYSQRMAFRVVRRTGSEARCGSIPGKFVSGEHDGIAMDLDLPAGPAEVYEPGVCKRVFQSGLVDMEVVIPEHVIKAAGRSKLAERLWN